MNHIGNLQNLAIRMGTTLPNVEPAKTAYNKGDYEDPLSHIADSFTDFSAQDNKVFNGYEDLNPAPNSVKHKFSDRHSAETIQNPEGTEQLYLEKQDGRVVVAELTNRAGDEQYQYILIDDHGKLRADIKVANPTLQEGYSEEWRFYGPGSKVND